MTSPSVDSFPNKRQRLASYDNHRQHYSPVHDAPPHSPPPQYQHHYQSQYPPPQHQHSYAYHQAPPPPPPQSAPLHYAATSGPLPGTHSHIPPPPPPPPSEPGPRHHPGPHTLPMPLQYRQDPGPEAHYRPAPHAYYATSQYTSEPLSAHTPTTPSQPPSAADPAARQHVQAYGPTYRTQTDAPLPSPYQQSDHDMPQGQPNNTSGTNLEQHKHASYAPSAQQPQSPDQANYEASYGYGSSALSMQQDAQQRRKAVRASQACESCRQKKCKCDEERPRCSQCITNDTQCQYRTLPPPKQERNMIQVIDAITALGTQLQEMKDQSVPRHEFMSLRNDVQSYREEVRTVQMHSKRSSDKSLSPGQHSNFAAPAVIHNHMDTAMARAPVYKSIGGQDQRDAVAYSPAGSHRSDPVISTSQRRTASQVPQHTSVVQKTNTASIDDSAVKDFDPLQGQLSIPVEHETGAHKLLIAWDAIHPLYDGIIDKEYAKNYVWREETQRGQLRLYGQGEGHDGSNRRKTAPPSLESPLCSEADSVNSGAAPADGFWGFSFDGPKARPVDDIGGLDADGSLCLDSATLTRLFHSFMENIWIMHPFMNQSHTKMIFEKFMRRYARDPGSPTSSFSTKSEPIRTKLEDPSRYKGLKRMRTDEYLEETGTPSKIPRSPREMQNSSVERSISNAIVLLMFALGRICEHKDPLPPPVSGDMPLQPQSDVLSPLDLGHTGTNGLSRTASVDSQFLPPPKPVRHLRNIDKLPGLAYYSYATGILGEQLGAPDLGHVHARLLAGLYMGQMARVIDSWSWIHSACVGWQLLCKEESDLEKEPRERADALKFAYWTCLQLESDIIAEMSELPHSGISKLEDKMPLPGWSTVDYHPDSWETTIMIYYSAQINLRKILNRAHSALYSSRKEALKNPGWTILYAEDLAEQLSDWKKGLPPQFAWTDEDEPPQDINATRLRAKYYGAQYIIHRPFLHHLLQDEFGKTAPNAGRLSTLKSKEKKGLLDLARNTIEAASKSTIAFDGLVGRPIVTNIFGTAHAQFGNILVLAACYTSKRYRWFVHRQILDQLIERTVKFVENIAALAPTMRTNLRILRNVTMLINRIVPNDGDMIPPDDIGDTASVGADASNSSDRTSIGNASGSFSSNH